MLAKAKARVRLKELKYKDVLCLAKLKCGFQEEGRAMALRG